ncbi:MAG: YbaB/EbfC family nucleoid-associated protein [Patescibacteria group bacterium]
MIDLDKVLESKDSLEEIQRILSAQTVTGQTPSGKIKIIMTCDKSIKEVIIDPTLTVTSPDHVAALSKAIMTAFIDGENKIAEKATDLIEEATN